MPPPIGIFSGMLVGWLATACSKTGPFLPMNINSSSNRIDLRELGSKKLPIISGNACELK